MRDKGISIPDIAKTFGLTTRSVWEIYHKEIGKIIAKRNSRLGGYTQVYLDRLGENWKIKSEIIEKVYKDLDESGAISITRVTDAIKRVFKRDSV